MSDGSNKGAWYVIRLLGYEIYPDVYKRSATSIHFFGPTPSALDAARRSATVFRPAGGSTTRCDFLMYFTSAEEALFTALCSFCAAAWRCREYRLDERELDVQPEDAVRRGNAVRRGDAVRRREDAVSGT